MAKDLTSEQIDALSKPGNHRVSPGLYLRIGSKPTFRTWAYRYEEGGKDKWLKIGPCKIISLKEARVRAGELKADVYHERPVHTGLASKLTFAQVVEEFLPIHTAGKAESTKREWLHSLTVKAAPLAKLQVDRIKSEDVKKLLLKYWEKQPHVADKLRIRLERALGYAAGSGYRKAGPNPAAWRGVLKDLLPPLNREHMNFEAVRYQYLPSLFEKLEADDSQASRALRFTILTVSRAGPVLKATWSQVDEAGELWTVPADNMKGRTAFVQPLSTPAYALLGERRGARASLFPGLDPKAMLLLLRKLTGGKETVHGTARSGFKDWCDESAGAPDTLSEACLAHLIGSKTRQAYARAKLLAPKADLLWKWSCFLAGKDWREESVKAELGAIAAGDPAWASA